MITLIIGRWPWCKSSRWWWWWWVGTGVEWIRQSGRIVWPGHGIEWVWVHWVVVVFIRRVAVVVVTMLSFVCLLYSSIVQCKSFGLQRNLHSETWRLRKGKLAIQGNCGLARCRWEAVQSKTRHCYNYLIISPQCSSPGHTLVWRFGTAWVHERWAYAVLDSSCHESTCRLRTSSEVCNFSYLTW